MCGDSKSRLLYRIERFRYTEVLLYTTQWPYGRDKSNCGESEDGGERENSDSEDEGTGEEEQKTKPSFAIIPNNTTPVPLGWPK
uniref:Uncharacterized protein n=1 Tax=Amphimedon queenslandica TaxID=400682 RepID=A0A1X7SVT4_AMPQE